MKKISFSFTKSKAFPLKRKSESNKDIQFIDCIDGNAIKIKGVTAKEKEDLIIPVKNVKSGIIDGTKAVSEKTENSSEEEQLSSKVEQPSSDAEKPLSEAGSIPETEDSATLKKITTETLEDLAVREILEDSQKLKRKAPLSTLKVLPAVANEAASAESTLEDYDNVPVTDFGMAMLRGMGWKPEKGIGKNERIVEPTFPVLRPKGMGLGIEKKKLAVTSSSDESADLILKKGSYVQVLAGSHKHTYGEVQSFDEEAGRVIIKPALGVSNISVNEIMIQVVSKSEYKRSSRVLNQSKYEEYKRREEENELARKDSRSDSSDYKRKKKHGSETNGRNSRE